MTLSVCKLKPVYCEVTFRFQTRKYLINKHINHTSLKSNVVNKKKGGYCELWPDEVGHFSDFIIPRADNMSTGFIQSLCVPLSGLGLSQGQWLGSCCTWLHTDLTLNLHQYQTSAVLTNTFILYCCAVVTGSTCIRDVVCNLLLVCELALADVYVLELRGIMARYWRTYVTCWIYRPICLVAW